MKWLCSGLTFVNVSAVAGLLLGSAFHGLGRGTAICALLFAAVLAVFAWFETRDDDSCLRENEAAADSAVAKRPRRYRRVWFWLLAACFAMFALRSFCWLIFLDGNDLRIQSPNNLGDLALHIAYIKNFASGVPLWPENPIYVFSNMRYPAGTDLFNALLLLGGVNLIHGLVWAGLLASAATCYALYRWAGAFGIAGFLFNGGLAGFQFFQTWQFRDYQGISAIAWKSLPLSMFVTQRGVLYAIPAGLLLLCHWRAKYFPRRASTEATPGEAPARGILPFWLELTFYATMPLFHVHTFMALSIVAAFFFVIGNRDMRKQLATAVGAAVIPATFFMWTITDHFHAGSILEWKPGWVQHSGDMGMPFFIFWLYNFGVLVILAIPLIALCIARAVRPNERFDFRAHPALAFLTPAFVIFLFACLVKTAPWEWDNIKLIVWAYLILLPFVWSELIAHWPIPIRAGVCAALFASGFISVIGGLAVGRPGFGIADRAEVDEVGKVVKQLPATARFAAFPIFNHPLLLQGRKLVMGYPGHLWTQGFNYSAVEKQLNTLMRGEAEWRQEAQALGVRYLFWGEKESTNYPTSTRPWEHDARLVATGDWGAIYDLQSAPLAIQAAGQ